MASNSLFCFIIIQGFRCSTCSSWSEFLLLNREKIISFCKIQRAVTESQLNGLDDLIAFLDSIPVD